MPLAELLSNLIPAVFFVMLLLERLIPGRPLPKVKGWLLKGLAFFLLTGAVNTFVPMLFAKWFGDWSLLHLSSLGMITGGILGALVSDGVGYWVHRGMHKSHFVWRWTHQMHHSAERMDLAGMSYTHPLEILTFFPITIAATMLLGLSPDAAAVAGFLGFATAVFQHANIRTPRILGYFVMRPEQHGLHHERNVHAFNYASFPIWDIVFRTFRNPASFPAEYGFWDGASKRFGAMLLGKDVGTQGA